MKALFLSKVKTPRCIPTNFTLRFKTKTHVRFWVRWITTRSLSNVWICLVGDQGTLVFPPLEKSPVLLKLKNSVQIKEKRLVNLGMLAKPYCVYIKNIFLLVFHGTIYAYFKWSEYHTMERGILRLETLPIEIRVPHEKKINDHRIDAWVLKIR